MRDDFKHYVISLYKDIPQEVYEGLLSVFCLGIVLFIAFWSYNRPELLPENIMNVVVFVPVGVLLGFMFQGSRFKMTWWKALLIGCSISITIEALQFCFMKGFSELDDVMHNTLGCILGYMPAWCWGRKWSIMGR